MLPNLFTKSSSLSRCPNPLDPASQQAVLFNPQPPAPQAQTRRFTISTFQFLPDGEFKDPDEEVRMRSDFCIMEFIALNEYIYH